MRILPSRIHVYSSTEDVGFVDANDWTDALVSVRCKRFNPPLANAVDLEFAREWIYEWEKNPDIFCLSCVVFVHRHQFQHVSALYQASQGKKVAK